MSKKMVRIDKPTREELLESLNDLVEEYVANRGTPSQFISCITPGRKIPLYWRWALHLLDRESKSKD